MVNEINKPPQATNENSVLVERLAASNRNLQEMQTEHRQLVEEMAMLRQRATELCQLAAASHVETTVATVSPSQNSIKTDTSDSANMQQETPSSSTAADTAIGAQTATTSASEILENNSINTNLLSMPLESQENNKTKIETLTDTAVTLSDQADEDEDPAASAEYIRAKVAEIAALKAQFKRVQHLIDTTNLIEQHIATKESDGAPAFNSTDSQADAVPLVGEPPAQNADTLLQRSAPSQAATGDDANTELISTMLTMFNEFSTDMRGQVESLRAERERIKTLKEALINRKRSS